MKLTLLLGFSLVLIACRPITVVNTIAPHSTYDVSTGLSYGSHPRHGLDIYRPAERNENLPVVVFFYGGAWQKGDRSDYLFAAEALTSMGFVTVLPDYRLYPEVTFPAFVEDGALAAQWVRDNIDQYGGDPCQIFLSGHSAGAHIAALLHFDESYLSQHGDFRPAGLVGLAGPYDFLPLTDPVLVKVFPEATRQSSQPVNFVDGDEAPALLLHGSDDETVIPRNTRRLTAKIQSSGGSVMSKIYDGVGHRQIMLAMAKGFRWITETREDTGDFIATQSAEVGTCS